MLSADGRRILHGAHATTPSRKWQNVEHPRAPDAPFSGRTRAGGRFAFAVWATHSGAATVGRFSARTDITGAHIWEFALVLMAYAEVLSRIGVLQVRRVRALHGPASLSVVAADAGHARDRDRQAA
jgi:hypothetical protein